MCTGLEIPLIMAAVGAATSAGGSYLSNQSAQQNAQKVAAARNSQMQATLAATNKIADESRSTFTNRMADVTPTALPAEQAALTDQRTAGLTNAVTTATPADIPLSGSAPAVVKSEVAQKMSDATNVALDQAKSLGTLGGYGDLQFNQGVANTEASNKIGMLRNLQQGRLSLLPAQQDLAGDAAYRPTSPIGGIMQGAGNALGSAAGAGYFTPAASNLTDPASWAATVTRG